jgi:hypothetical protein
MSSRNSDVTVAWATRSTVGYGQVGAICANLLTSYGPLTESDQQSAVRGGPKGLRAVADLMLQIVVVEIAESTDVQSSSDSGFCRLRAGKRAFESAILNDDGACQTV